MKIDFIKGQDDAVFSFINKGLTDFSVPVLGDDLPWTDDKFSFVLHDDNGDMIGGLIGTINWRWCYIKLLWVEESKRGSGYGRALMERTEQYARNQHCVGMHVHTLSYQAPEFYELLGYEKFGQLDNYPPGHCRIYFKKNLV